MKDWIKSSDRLPEIAQDVLFYHDDDYHLGYLTRRQRNQTLWLTWMRNQRYDFNCIENVQWWCLLPDAPLEKDEI